MGELARGYRAKNGGHDVNEVDSRTILVIKLPDSRTLRIISRSLFLMMVLLTLPLLRHIIRASSGERLHKADANSGIANGFNIMSILLRDLVDEGLIKKGDRGFIFGAGEIDDHLEFLRDAGVDLFTARKNADAHQIFDFIFMPSLRGIERIDGVLKDDGLFISPLDYDELRLPRNFKIVYLRRFENTLIAMRKFAGASFNGAADSAPKRVLCGVTSENKKAALKGLEDVYLEPPRRTALSKETRLTSRKIKFLPDLLKDSLDEYPRRVFISDDSDAVDWFYNHYPMKDQEFEVYNLDFRAEVSSLGGVAPQEMVVSTWLMKTVRREDFVVMKAEAQVVEEMLKDKTLCLVDELFLECKNQWQEKGSKRAYWQCLELYGKVKDEGIAVHQWWR